MAKQTTSIAFKNACIDIEGNRIIEVMKDTTLEYDLKSILSMWDGIEGISISIQKNSDLSPLDESGE